MANDGGDVLATLEYRIDAAIIRALPGALLLCLLGMLVFALDDEPPVEMVVVGGLLIAVGIAGVIAAAVLSIRPGPAVYVLSPQGLTYRRSRTRHLLIPWREIRGVASVDISTWNPWLKGLPWVTLRDVPVIMLSKRFYDASLLDPWFRRGPYWNTVYKVKSELVQMALLQEDAQSSEIPLCDAIEARWRAFGDRAAREAPAQPISPVSTHVSAAGGKSGFASVGSAIKVAVPLIGIFIVGTNIAGLWATQGQLKAREQQKVWAAEQKALQEENDRFEAEKRQREKEFEDLFRRTEEMGRTSIDPLRRRDGDSK